MKKKKTLIIIILFTAIILAYLVKWISPIEPFRISGESMKPNLEDKQIVWIDKRLKNDPPKRGDIVIFKPNFYSNYVKRVIAVPGDTIQITQGYVVLNGERLPENYIYAPIINDSGVLKDEVTLKENEYICLGDNRNNSYDSRDMGPINISQMIGKVITK